MKRFKIISAIFLTVIAVIFGCNIFYLASLYGSIRASVERDVMTALADADLDELWIRADRASKHDREKLEMSSTSGQPRETPRKGETSVYQDRDGDMAVTTTHPDGTVTTEGYEIQERSSFTNEFINAVGQQFHALMDPYVPIDLEVMDSVLVTRLSDRHIYPGYVASEVLDSAGNTILASNVKVAGPHDEFTYCYNRGQGLSYRVYMTPLTRHIISEMSGVIVTVFLLMVSFAVAFWYLFRTVSRLRTIEEMKDDFVSNMTHELKTPIAIAYSANDALLNYDTSNDTAKKEKYLTIANRQLRRLGELVEGILAMSMERRRTMRLSHERISLAQFVEEIAAAQRMRNEKPVTIETDTTPGAEVEADPTHLANILNNLIDNAIKYSGDSVRIAIRCTMEGISVADDGIGIPSSAIPHLFDRFYRVPRGNRQDVRGYGIGLYYVRNILDRMGWDIEVSSTPGHGSVFNIKFKGK